MSTPQNPLANYRSYSYYHILALCDSTETAEALSKHTGDDVWRHATSGLEFERYHKYSPKQIKITDSTERQVTGQYCILIDGSTDADVAIDTLRFTAATAASVTDLDHNTSTAMEGTITFSEPRGISFMHTLVEASRSMNVDAAHCVYVVKTFFVGHALIDGVDQQQMITNIDPLKFIAYDVRGSYTEAGGTYVMEFACVQNGISRLPQYCRSADSFSINAGTTLESTLKELSDHINMRYEQMYSCVESTLRSQDTANSTSVADRITRVKYNITCDDEYKNASYLVTNQRQQQKDEPACYEGAHVTCPAGTSIDDAIHRIMLLCPKVAQQLAGTADVTGPRYGYKIDSSYTSKIVAEPDNTQRIQYTVNYHVRRFLEPRSVDFVKLLSSQTALDDAQRVELQRNLIEFDYIYTGKNVDILELDIKLNQGLAYLQIASTASSTIEYAGEAGRATGVVGGTAAIDRSHPGNTQIPVFFSTDIKSPLFKNIQNASVGMQAAYTLSKHSSFEVTDATMTIYGNPLLLNSVNQVSSAQTRTTTQVDHFADFTRVPAFAKVNIKMPRTNDDIALLKAQTTQSGNSDYATDFWFRGYYYVYGIQSTFEGGLFTQQLQMLGIPEQTTIELAQSGSTATTTINERVERCYDKLVTTTTTAKPHVPTSVPAKPVDHPQMTPADTSSVIDTRELTVDDVTGYTDKAPEPLKAAIKEAAALYGVSPVLLARMAYIESTYNDKAANSKSSATGTFQFVSQTWLELTSKNKIKGLPPTTPPDEALKKRSDVQLSTNAAAYYIQSNQRIMANKGVRENNTSTAAYLAHFAGPGGATAVLLAIQNGDGNLPLADAYVKYGVSDRSKAAKVISSNALSTSTTAQMLYEYAAGKMAKSIKGGVKIASAKNPAPKPVVPSGNVSSIDPTIAIGYKKTGGDQLAKTISAQPTQQLKKCDDTKPE